jgi:hypothetical protein
MSLLARNHIHSTFKSPAGAKGTYHSFGYYQAPVADANLNQGSATVVLGTANGAYGAHAFLVAKQAGTVSGGTNGTATITLTGTTVTSAGVRAATQSEVIVADITALSANVYIESTKMWIGQVTYTLAATGDRTTFALDFNYGFVSACHFWEKKVTIRQFEVTGRAAVTDTAFNVQLLKHSATGWTYNATAFVAGGTVLFDMASTYSTESSLISGERFHFHRKGLTTVINGAAVATLTAPNEGVVARITTGQNGSVDTCDIRILYS